MKSLHLLLAVFLVVGLFAVAVSADDIKGKERKKVSTEYKEIVESDDIVEFVKQFTGLVAKDKIGVTVKGARVAVIPKTSKFVGIEVHEECLTHQYGTHAWYECEVKS